MPAQDSCQPQIVRALEKAGWLVSTKVKAIRSATILAHPDIEAIKDGRLHIIVEVKCFPGANRTQELYVALGQYVVYRELLKTRMPDAVLFLAVPHDDPDISDPIITASIQATRVNILLVDLANEEIVEWRT